jgi:hypothetical protein
MIFLHFALTSQQFTYYTNYVLFTKVIKCASIVWLSFGLLDIIKLWNTLSHFLDMCNSRYHFPIVVTKFLTITALNFFTLYSEVFLSNKISCLAAALGVTKIITIFLLYRSHFVGLLKSNLYVQQTHVCFLSDNYVRTTN